jgi:WD40 repeat protein
MRSADADPVGTAAHLLRQELLGSNQDWLKRASSAVRHKIPFLDDVTIQALSDDPHEYPPRDGLDAMEPVALPLARAIDAVIQMEQSSAVPELTPLMELMDRLERSGLISVLPESSAPDWEVGGGRGRALMQFAADSGHPSGAYAALLLKAVFEPTNPDHPRERSSWRFGQRAVHTMGTPFEDITAEITVPILTTQHGTGAVSSLHLVALSAGPAGLHADPGRMTFTRIDEDFAEGLRKGFAASSHANGDACVLWSVTDAEGSPARHLGGDSATAALAMALNELRADAGKLSRRVVGLRPRRLDRNCAITAGLDHERLTKVKAYGPKLAAASEQNLRVVVALEALEEARAVARSLRMGTTAVRGAADVRAATIETRTKLNPAFLVALSVVVIVLTVIVTAGYQVLSVRRDAQREASAAQLAQRATGYMNRPVPDRRMAALAALAAYRLDPTDQAVEAMAQVAEGNEAIVGATQLKSHSVVGVAASDTTMLAADLQEQVTAWSIPDFRGLGTLATSGEVRALEAADSGPDVFGVVTGRTLGVYQGGARRAPTRIAETVTSLNEEGSIFGPYFSGNGLVVFDDSLSGLYWPIKRGQPPVQFSLRSDPLLADPEGGELEIVAAAVDSFASVPTPDSSSADLTLLVGTSARQVVRLVVELPTLETSPPRVRLHAYVPAGAARAAITALTETGDGRLLIGTERGLQLWNTEKNETIEFPYRSVSQEVQRLIDLGAPENVAVLTNDGLTFLRTKGEVALASQTLRYSDRTLTDATSWSGDAATNRVIAVDSSGRLVLFDPENRRLGPAAYPGSTIVAFTPNGYLLLTQIQGSPNYVTSLRAAAVPNGSSEDPDNLGRDPFRVTYNLPAEEGFRIGYPYLNAAAATRDYVAASGMTVSRRGRLWVWNIGGALAKQLDFAAPNPDPATNVQDRPVDVVTKVGFTANGSRLVAYNPRRGAIGVWEAGSWRLLRTIPVPPDPEATSGMQVSDAGYLVVKVSAKDAVQELRVVDVRTGITVRTFPAENVGRLAISPDGSWVAFSRLDNSLHVASVHSGKLSVIAENLGDGVSDLAFSPDGSKLAYALPKVASVSVLDTERFQLTGPAWFETEGSQALDLAWSPDSKYVAVNTITFTHEGPGTGETLALDTTTRNWSDVLCNIAGGRPTEADLRVLGPAVGDLRLCG